MNTAEPNPIHRRWYYWLSLVPLVVGASWTLLVGAALNAYYHGHYGKAVQAVQMQALGARREANLYGWLTSGLTLTAIIMATILIRPFKSDALPVGLRAVIRIGLALALVGGSIILAAYGLSAVARFVK